jgi:hypothetical protein
VGEELFNVDRTNGQEHDKKKQSLFSNDFQRMQIKAKGTINDKKKKGK